MTARQTTDKQEALRAGLERMAAGWTIPANTSGCTIQGLHCESCGSTDYDDLENGDQGYSACCNEIVSTTHDCRNHHGSIR